MITATGIIAEYNPFHNGHLYQLREATHLTGQPVVVAMSASFMQRGEPACLSKWLRARLAVETALRWCWSCPRHSPCAAPSFSPAAACSYSPQRAA